MCSRACTFVSGLVSESYIVVSRLGQCTLVTGIENCIMLSGLRQCTLVAGVGHCTVLSGLTSCTVVFAE